jgi:murein DD-endopeptidase MepM/ murein hydrolase activator NlpD
MKNFNSGDAGPQRQRIKRRKKPSLLSKAMTYHAGGRTDTDLIHQIKQKPARVRRGKTRRFSCAQFRFKVPAIPAFFRRKKVSDSSGPDNPGTLSRFAGFSLSRLFTLLGLAVILAFSILALNWQGPVITLPGDNGEFQRNLASYAGLDARALQPEDEEIPLDLMETFSWSGYEVKRGDSVSKIAADHGISMDAVIASNGISNARRLREGETLKIPNMDGIPYTVRKGDTLSKISKTLGVPLEAILDANDIQDDNISQGTVLFIPGARMRREDLKLALGELFVYPVRGRLSSPFGWRNDPINGVRRYHAAIDLAAGLGTPVKAAMDGRVSTVGYNSVYGRYIILSHSGGFQTMYAHLNAASVKQEDYVYQGSRIGEVGNTGYSTGPHLHFAVFKSGKAVNPLEYLGK